MLESDVKSNGSVSRPSGAATAVLCNATQDRQALGRDWKLLLSKQVSVECAIPEDWGGWSFILLRVTVQICISQMSHKHWLIKAFCWKMHSGANTSPWAGKPQAQEGRVETMQPTSPAEVPQVLPWHGECQLRARGSLEKERTSVFLSMHPWHPGNSDIPSRISSQPTGTWSQSFARKLNVNKL